MVVGKASGGGGAGASRVPTTESVLEAFTRKLCEAIASLKFFASMLLAYRFANASKKPRTPLYASTPPHKKAVPFRRQPYITGV